MSRKLLIPLLTVVFLAAPAAFGAATPFGLSGSVQAAVNYNSSKSNSGNFHKSNKGSQVKAKKLPGKMKSGTINTK
jgi:hypothetical protein